MRQSGTFECESCHAISDVLIETVDGRGPGFKCPDCSWWTWLPERDALREIATRIVAQPWNNIRHDDLLELRELLERPE